MEYIFTQHQLRTIHQFLEISPWVSDPYRWYMALPKDADVSAEPVEDFAIAFYTAYNKMQPGTY